MTKSSNLRYVTVFVWQKAKPTPGPLQSRILVSAIAQESDMSQLN